MIAESLKGRNLNSVKNRFHSLLKKYMVIEPSKESIEKLIKRIRTSEKEYKTNNISVKPEKINNEEDSTKEKIIKVEDTDSYIPPINPSLFNQMPQQYPIFNSFNLSMDMFGNPFGRFNGFMPRFPIENPFLMYGQLRSKFLNLVHFI